MENANYLACFPQFRLPKNNRISDFTLPIGHVKGLPQRYLELLVYFNYPPTRLTPDQ